MIANVSGDVHKVMAMKKRDIFVSFLHKSLTCVPAKNIIELKS